MHLQAKEDQSKALDTHEPQGRTAYRAQKITPTNATISTLLASGSAGKQGSFLNYKTCGSFLW